jgi:iron-sulfur cluster repair protein YtfE (RIC family)
MSLDPMKTVAELAVALPNATRVFEKTKIDYCCGGDQLLGAACAKAGVDLPTLEQMPPRILRASRTPSRSP